MASPGIQSTRTAGRTRAGSRSRRWSHLVYGVLGQSVEHGQVAVGGDGVAMASPGIRSTRTAGRTRAGSSRRRWTHLVYGVLGQPVEQGQVAVGGDGLTWYTEYSDSL